MKRFVLKVDDFRLNDGLIKFERLFALCQRIGVPMSIGVIGAGLRGGRFRAQESFARLQREGAIELWNHSYNHRDMTQLPDEAVAWEIAATTSISERMLGHRPLGFGAPFNKCDERVARVAREQGMAFTYETALPGTPVVTPEYNVPFDGQPNLAEFIKRVEHKGIPDTLIVQVHPGRWLSRGFEHMAQCLDWLQEAGYTPATMQALLGLDPQRASGAATVHELLVSRLAGYWTQQSATYDARLKNFSSYFLARFRANSSAIFQVLQDLGVDQGARTVVDVGCGLAQWSLPFFDFDKDATLWAYDTNGVVCDALGDARAQGLIPGDLRVAQEDFTKSAKLASKSIDVTVCANALNYIPVSSFAKQLKDVSKDSAKLVVLNQTGAFNHQGVLDALASSNRTMAQERAMAELRQQLVRLGFAGFMPARTTLSADELEAVLYAFGFQATDDFVPAWERTLRNVPTFVGLVFTRRTWVRAEQLAPAFRPSYRLLLCGGGFCDLDDEVFGEHEADLKDPKLALMKARAGRHASSPDLGAELELGRVLRAGDFRGAARLVSGSGTPSAEWLLAGATAALIAADPALANGLARHVDGSTLPPCVFELLRAAYHLESGDLDAAREALSQ